MTPREFENILMLVVAIIDFILLIYVSFKIFTSAKKTIIKIVLFLITISLFLPFWYLVQFVINYSLAIVVLNNQIVDCIYLNKKNCKNRQDCELVYLEGGLGKGDPICTYVSERYKKLNN